MNAHLRTVAFATAVLAFSSNAWGQRYVFHHQVFHVPMRPAESRAIDPLPDFTALYVAEWRDAPMIPPPNIRPLLVRMDPDLRPILPAWTFARPGELMPPPPPSQYFLHPRELYPNDDGTTVICGDFEETLPDALTLRGAFVMRLDPAYQVIWFREYPQIDSFFDIVQMRHPAGLPIEFLVCGYRTTLASVVPQTAVVAALDFTGNVMWAHDVWAFAPDMRGKAMYHQVIRMSEQDAALVGAVNMVEAAPEEMIEADVLVTRITIDGVFLFNRVYGRPLMPGPGGSLVNLERGISIARIPQTPEMVVVGEVTAREFPPVGAPPLYEDVLAMRLDPNGFPMWMWQYDYFQGYDAGRDVKVFDDHVSYVAADVTTPLFGPLAPNVLDVSLLRLDPGGIPMPPVDVFGGTQSDWAAQLILDRVTAPVPVPEVTLLGTTLSFGPGYMIPYLIERFQQVCRECQSKQIMIPFQPYPMPIFEAEWMPFQAFAEPRELLSLPIDMQMGTICKKCLVGDMNCDGVVSVSDIGPFVLALTNPAGYIAAFPNCCLEAADVNCDGFVTVGDIGPFVQLLTG